MIDIFIRANTPITDIPKVLSGFDCNLILVRNGGPTTTWERTADGWAMREPGMTLYEDLSADYIRLCAYRADTYACVTRPVDEVAMLTLDEEEAREWLAYMERHRYAVEDAIGCTILAEHQGAEINCASANFPLSDFKWLNMASTQLAKKILSWTEAALAAGADQIDVAIAKQLR